MVQIKDFVGKQIDVSSGFTDYALFSNWLARYVLPSHTDEISEMVRKYAGEISDAVVKYKHEWAASWNDPSLVLTEMAYVIKPLRGSEMHNGVLPVNEIESGIYLPMLEAKGNWLLTERGKTEERPTIENQLIGIFPAADEPHFLVPHGSKSVRSIPFNADGKEYRIDLARQVGNLLFLDYKSLPSEPLKSIIYRS